MGHLKTMVILAGGFLLFDEAMPPKKLAGVVLAMGGIVWCAAGWLLTAGEACEEGLACGFAVHPA